MAFHIKNTDTSSPICAIKSSSSVGLELVFREKECDKLLDTIPEWLDGRGPFRAVWQRGDELKIVTVSPPNDRSFQSLSSHPVSEREIEVLLTTLVSHDCLRKEHKKNLRYELICGFAGIRLAVIQEQTKELLELLKQIDATGQLIYVDLIDTAEGVAITKEDKKNIQTAILQLNQINDIIFKLLADKKEMITKEEMAFFQSFNPFCLITCGYPLERSLLADQQIGNDIKAFAQDFKSFLSASFVRSLSLGAAKFGLHKSVAEHKLVEPVSDPMWNFCTIL